MGDEAFDQQILTEKLSKLNSSQQSIESLSKWCVTHRKKARQVVEIWDKLFKSAQREQQVSFLYLANDILQNSRRQGSEFVNEFWKFLPSALKVAYDSGHQSSRKVVMRLVGIWEERKVFGSRSQNLKNDIVGKNSSPRKNSSRVENLPAIVNNGKKPNPIKVVKKDAVALRVKLDADCLPAKILTSFQSAHDEIATEEGAFTKSKNALSSVQELEKDIVVSSSQGNLLGPEIVNEIKKQEDMLQQCVDELANAEAIRVSLVSQLKEAIEDQESRLDVIRNELHVIRGHVKQAADIRLQLAASFSAPPITITEPVAAIPTFPPPLPPTNPTPVAAPTNSSSFLNSVPEDANTKASAAAAMAAKLASSASSAQMLTNIFSQLVAEEEAKSGKRQKLDTPNAEGSSSAYVPTMQPPMVPNQLQVPFIPPPPSLAPPGSSPVNQLAVPYGYGGNNMQPPLVRPGPPALQAQAQGQPQPQPQPQQQQPQQHQQQVQQPNGGYYRPPGMGFYGQTHQPATPPIHRQ